MMKKLSVHIFFIFLLYIPITGFSQLHTRSGKALKLYNEARHFYEFMELDKASNQIDMAVKADPDFLEAHLLRAELNADIKKYSKAIESYRKVVSIDSSFYPNAMYNLGHIEFLSGMYTASRQHLTSFLKFKGLQPSIIKKARKDLAGCLFSIEGVKHPVPLSLQNLGPGVNTPMNEYWPSLTADEQTLVFTVLVPEGEFMIAGFSQKKFQEDFYISVRTDSVWQTRKPLGKPINSPRNEGAQSLSVDGRMMYFTACNRSDGMGSCDIYLSYRHPGGWTNPNPLSPPLNSKYWDAQPSISADGHTLYFVSNRPGGFGKMDIWISHYAGGKWQQPLNAGAAINTSGNEMSPFIHPDKKTLYFSSDGHPGFGGFDLFFTRNKGTDTTWSKPENLGYPINTHGDEIGFIVNAAGTTAYFSSDRIKENGKDIYAFDLYKEARPGFVTYMKGKVYDSETNRPLNAHFELTDLDNDTLIMEAYAGIDGSFLVCIPTDHNYALNVSKEGYLFFSDHFPLKGMHAVDHPFIKDVPMNPIRVGESTILRNIFFAFNSYKLKRESMVELEKLKTFLKQYPDLHIEISGHTDWIGTNEYNLELSKQRSRAVYLYLIKDGIEASRLTYVGYGETKPIQDNNTEEGRAANRRTEIRIVKMGK
ncbi:MAG: OmpA family protein [Chlorobi bacterium]|nr:OmpA family protein [Chlorobiota bacterium]